MVALMSDVTGFEPELWGTIIGFGSCHYRYPTGTEGDSPIVGFAARRQATTVYLLDGVDAHADSLAALGPHESGVGCLYIKDVEAVDTGILRTIIAASRDYALAGGGEYATITVND